MFRVAIPGDREYLAEEFRADLRGRAFHLTGGREPYSVLIGPECLCECRAFYSAGMCKHILALTRHAQGESHESS